MDLTFHPPLSAFPVALITVAAILEGISFFRPNPNLSFCIRLNLILATVFVGLAFYTGYWAAEEASQTFKIPEDVIAQHHRIGRLLLFTIAPCAALHWCQEKATRSPKVFRALYLLFLAICLGLVIYTGLLGGQLIFQYGAGVKASP